MKIYKLLSIIFLSILLYSCGSNSGHKKSDFTITTNAKKNKLSINDVLKLSIENKKNHNIDSVIYLLDNKKITEETEKGSRSQLMSPGLNIKRAAPITGTTLSLYKTTVRNRVLPDSGEWT